MYFKEHGTKVAISLLKSKKIRMKSSENVIIKRAVNLSIVFVIHYVTIN